MLRKRFKLKKKNVVITTIIIIVLFICNIVFALASNCTHKSDVLTVISGWISGISTTVLGLIAIKQTSNYDELSNDFLEKQASVLKNIELMVNKQNDAMWRFHHYEMFKAHYDEVLSYELEFDKYDSNTINLKLGQALMQGGTANIVLSHAFDANYLTSISTRFHMFCITNVYYLDGKDKMLNACEKYAKYVNDFSWELLTMHAAKKADGTKCSDGKGSFFNDGSERVKEIWNEVKSLFVCYRMETEKFCLRLTEDESTQESLKTELDTMKERQIDFVRSLQERTQ